MRWVGVVVLAGALAACGSSSDTAAPPAPTAAPTTTTSTTSTTLATTTTAPAAATTTAPSGPGTVHLELTSPSTVSSTVAVRVLCNAASGHAFVQVTGMAVAGLRIDFTVNVANFTGPSTYTSAVTVVRTDTGGSQNRATTTVPITFTSLVTGTFTGSFPTTPQAVSGTFSWACSP